jgi:hypothetical protein
MELVEEELAFPSSTPPPSEEEWKKCSEQQIWICIGCDKELESRHIRISLELSTEQRKWLRPPRRSSKERCRI